MGATETAFTIFPQYSWNCCRVKLFHTSCCSDWIQRAPPENILRVVMCLRILMRDVAYQKHFSDLDGVNILAGVRDAHIDVLLIAEILPSIEAILTLKVTII